MWLKITFDEPDIGNPRGNPYLNNIEASISNEMMAPIDNVWKPFRLSPIFPLVPQVSVPDISTCNLHFFNFRNAYRALGRLEKIAPTELKEKVFFSTGLCSVILICKEEKDLKDFSKIVEVAADASERWEITNSKIGPIECYVGEVGKSESIEIIDYSSLPLTERALVDEFKITIKLMLLKLTTHMPFELPKIQSLVAEVNMLIAELVSLYRHEVQVPSTLEEYSREDLNHKGNNLTIKHQNIDRIIQINSALSYVSTQAFSGAIPILERRSLIRRNSLLGIGSAILALNNIAHFIERSFSSFAFDEVISKQFISGAPLSGLDMLPKYDAKDWQSNAINTFTSPKVDSPGYLKLPYFSGRLGFRETEYSIAAAIQSISSGAGMEWSLMTLTHEMLHGHVRTIINALFFGDEKANTTSQRRAFYDKFKAIYQHNSSNDRLTDSVRAIIFTYCCLTSDFGSMTSKVEYTGDRYKATLLPLDELWTTFAQEYRNINEIFVHILDLNYFYGSRLALYIPLIWGSWISVPHINGDLRQYILRSLLTISSKYKLELYQRFNKSVEILAELLTKHVNNKLDYPVIMEVLEILKDRDLLDKYYLPAFKASLIIVDLVNEVFISTEIRSKLFQDQYVKWNEEDEEEDSMEKSFKYQLPVGFNDEVIASPVAFLLDKMSKLLESNDDLPDIERETAFQFLALNSYD